MQRPAFTWALPLQILRPWKFFKTVRLDTVALLCVLIVFIVTALMVLATSPTGIVDSKLFPVHHRRVGGDSDDGGGECQGYAKRLAERLLTVGHEHWPWERARVSIHPSLLYCEGLRPVPPPATLENAS